MKKLLFLLASLLLAGNAMAEQVITFDPAQDKDVTTGGNVTGDTFTLSKGGVTITVDRGTINDNQYRLFAYTEENANIITVDVDVDWENLYHGEYGIFYGRLKSIQFICTADGTSQYGPGNLTTMGNMPGGDYTYTDNVGTFDTEGFNTRDTYYFKANSQVRCTQIIVTVYSDPTEKTATPTINLQYPWDNEYFCYIVEAVGEGEVNLYLDGQYAENPFRIYRDEEDHTYSFTATAQEEGKLVSDEATFEITVPAFKPQIIVTEGEDSYTIEAVMTDAYGYGYTIHLYGEYGAEGDDGYNTLPNPCVIPRTDEDATYYFGAIADYEGALSFPASAVVTIPAKEETPQPEVPQEGYWLARVLPSGDVIYDELQPGINADYIDVLNIEYPMFYEYCGFYFVANGQPYGAIQDMTPADLGLAENNPLYPGTNRYYINVGYSYTLGIHFAYDMDTMEMSLWAYVAKGGRVDVDEVNACKSVAGVRYYNMAGQEMPQAAGITIAVTTYTDGTTSVAKVIK